MKKHKGFTLIELLIVIGIIAILAAIIYVSVDPARRLAEARNAERWSSVNAILNAVLKSTVDAGGVLPVTQDNQSPTRVDIAPGEVYEIGTAAAAVNCTGATNQVDLSVLVDDYLSALPLDPSIPGTTANTGYSYSRSANGRITVSACVLEREVAISVSR